MPKSVHKVVRYIMPTLPRQMAPVPIPANSNQMLLVRDRLSLNDWQCLPMPRQVFVMFETNHNRPCQRNITAFKSSMVTITGPLGTIRQRICGDFAVIQNGEVATHQRPWRTERERKMQCMTTHKVLKNMIYGVSCGWQKTIRLFGKGFRAMIDTADERKLILRCGFARPLTFTAPIGISWEVLEADDYGYPIVIRGIDIEQVGNVAASLRRAKKMNLQGQGIRYEGENVKVRTKKGKR